MGTGVVFTNQGKKVMINRFYKSVPDYTPPSTFKVGTGTTTPTAADTDLSTPSGSPPATSTFVTGYPLIDETNMQGTIRCQVLTTDCNGQTLTEFGVFNTDGTPKMMSRLVHTPIVKTSSIQVIYIEKDKIKL